MKYDDAVMGYLFSFESLFLTLAICMSGFPFEVLRWVIDPWPLFFLLPLVVFFHHFSLAVPRRIFEKDAVLVCAALLLTSICCFVSRGQLIQFDYWVCIWLLTAAHWFCFSRQDDVSQSKLDRLAFVPLVSLPIVLFSLASKEPACASGFCLLLLIGALLASAIRGVRNENLLFRHLSRSLPGWLLLVLPIVVVLSQFLTWGTLKEPVVLFDCAHGSTASVGISLRVNEQFAEAPPGHGRFLAHVQKSGFKTVLLRKEITPKSLENVSIVVLLMNASPMKLQERKALLSFVESGGGLLVIGDHTDVEGTSSALNPLLKAFGAKLAFDTVWRRLDAGIKDVRYLTHPLTSHLDRIYFSTGCSISLDCCSSLEPFICSSSLLFSDIGDYGNDSYLGDASLNENEKLGSLPLAVAGSYGLGRVILFGDSAYFQNGVLVLNEKFLDRVLAWLNRSEFFRGVANLSYLISILAIVALCLVLLVKRCQLNSLLPLLVFGLCLSVLLASYVGTFIVAQKSPGEKVMALDLAHGNRCHFFWNSTAADMAYDSMDIWFREMCARDWDVRLLERGTISNATLKEAKLLTIVHPRTEYSPEELTAIANLLRRGGSVLLFVGPEAAGGRKSLLPALGLEVKEHPLGFQSAKMFAGEFPLEVLYGDGPWPEATIEADNALLSKGGLIPVAPVEVSGALVAARALGCPFIVYGSKYKGKIVLIGDRLHFSDYAFIDGQGQVDGQRLRILSTIMRFIEGRSK